MSEEPLYVRHGRHAHDSENHPSMQHTKAGMELIVIVIQLLPCITPVKAPGPSRTCNESKEEKERITGMESIEIVIQFAWM